MSEARRLGGLRAAEKRSESRDRFLDEVERVNPGLLQLARKLEARTVPYRPGNQSRVEWFLSYVEEHPGELWASMETKERYQWPEPELDYVPGSIVLTLCETDFALTEGSHSVRDLSMGRIQWLPAVVVDGVVRDGLLTLAESGEHFDVPVSMVRVA